MLGNYSSLARATTTNEGQAKVGTRSQTGPDQADKRETAYVQQFFRNPQTLEGPARQGAP
jgi:hypothetical protein